ncbi:MAG: uracil-DNA glycosylase [Proteobacteria bacterium]|nr:uracil-DNA glycosylase [Pseudomonadota bacterium]
MDRREAMLRELNLYPAWVRREPVPDAVSLSHADSVSAMPEAISVKEEGGTELPLFEQPAPTVQKSAEDSLREFQMKIAGGPLADTDWPELKEKVMGCELCGLRAGCTQTVFGSGNAAADWLFIGEAPGVDEDATGEPFVGHAGHLLDNMLLAIRLKRSEVYIANVIKCRPPEDRHPHVGEIDACLPYLRRQIDLIRPKIIVALGKTAASALLETDATIASLRGQLHEYKGIPVVVTFHPAYLLRSPMEKAKAWQDLCLAVQTMR